MEARKRRREARDDTSRDGSGRSRKRDRKASKPHDSRPKLIDDEMANPVVLASIKESYLGSKRDRKKKSAIVNPNIRGKGQR